MSVLKTPKGTADGPPRHCLLYDMILCKVKRIFVLYGAVPVSTPTFEIKDILTNKYGEDTKLIYDLKDQGGEICALRYDLTVPFARYLVSNNIRRMKRYQIGRVYRRDQPSVAKGRLREFIQADFDIAGECVGMMGDAEVVSCVDRILRSLDMGRFRIKVSDRRLLTSILKIAEVPDDRHSTVCSSIDKIEKVGWAEVKRELVQKGLTEDQVETIRGYIEMSGTEDVLEMLKSDKIHELDECRSAVCDMEELFRLCRILGCSENLVISLSLARGLDYYTGMILEGEYVEGSVGSVIGGGRYDHLTENLTEKGPSVPCVGFSVGVSRIFSLLYEKHNKECLSVVYVGASGGLFLDERLSILKILLDADIPSETFYTKRSSFGDQQAYSRKKGIPFVVVVGESELSAASVQVINNINGTKENIRMEEIAEYFLKYKDFHHFIPQ